MTKLLLCGSLVVLAGLSAGCSNNDSKESSSDGLRAVSVPADFTFATSRSVSVSLSASSAALGGQSAAVEVASPEGAVYYRGPIQADAPLALKLPVPTKDQKLSVTVFVNNEPKKALVDIQNNAASHVFQ